MIFDAFRSELPAQGLEVRLCGQVAEQGAVDERTAVIWPCANHAILAEHNVEDLALARHVGQIAAGEGDGKAVLAELILLQEADSAAASEPQFADAKRARKTVPRHSLLGRHWGARLRDEGLNRQQIRSAGQWLLHHDLQPQRIRAYREDRLG